MKPQIKAQEISNSSEKELFEKYSNQNNFFYLDSSDTASKWSQYSFMGFEPMFVLESHNGNTKLIKDNNETNIYGNPFDILAEKLSKFQTNIELPFTPFWGGTVGYISYEAAKYIDEKIFSCIFNDKENILPEMRFGFYNKIIVINKKTNQKWFIESEFPEEKSNINKKSSYKKEYPSKIHIGDLKSNFTKEEYLKAILKTKEYIKEGDIYQANISHRFQASFTGSPDNLYYALKQNSPAPFSSFLNCDSFNIYSSSPERFININKNKIQTRPIKGTIQKSSNPIQNKKNKQALLNSNKDKAELTMIIDLERNDLGQICDYGTVQVPEYITLEEYSHVYHLVSTIEGQLKENISQASAIKKLFPGGSITGAPKIRAMQIISELETVPREVYTGIIGYIGFNKNSDFNIAIRTMYSYNNQLYFHVGGGIVADSDPELEWQETLIKAKGMFNTIENYKNNND